MRFAAVIPVFNNKGTILEVALEARHALDEVLVVDDGSTDLPEAFAETLERNGIHLITHSVNQGKGAALKTGLKYCQENGIDYMIALDGDGQHSPQDIPRFIALLEEKASIADAIAIGVRDFNTMNVPGSSKFGRSFSNFWVRLETGVNCNDTQSGYRAYPVKAISKLRLRCLRYNFEIEVLVKALWGGCRLLELPISVKYEPPEKRISHFKPFADNARLSLLHTALVCRRLAPWGFKHLTPRQKEENPLSLWKHPILLLKYLLNENTSPEMLALSAAVSSFFACLPLIGCHMLVITYVCLRLRLNKVLALALQNIYMPPFTPFLCIEIGHLILHGDWLRSMTLKTVSTELHLRLLEWLLGSLIVAPVAAILSGIAVYIISHTLNAKRTKQS